MRIFFVLIVLFRFCLCSAQKNDKNQIDSIFCQTKKIEIYAYLVQSKWDKKDKYEYLKNDSIIRIPEIYLRNKIQISKSQITKLKKNLVKSNNEIGEIADCYEPRHTIVFYNKKDEILGFVELCFSCVNSRVSDNFIILKDKMLLQEKLFQEFGITYFEDTKEETDTFLKKSEEKEIELEKKFKNKNE
jgi:hypothetical protein